jgi:hypothetical protein
VRDFLLNWRMQSENTEEYQGFTLYERAIPYCAFAIVANSSHRLNSFWLMMLPFEKVIRRLDAQRYRVRKIVHILLLPLFQQCPG